MKNLLFLFLVSICLPAFAFRADSSAYQTQRLKVNALLKERSAKFGQYDQSLDSRTGFFGMQTKEDIKKSNEILRQIVLTDNNVFKELKILMDYKDQELSNSQNELTTIQTATENYKRSVKKLQDENQQLTEQVNGLGGGNFAWVMVVILAIALLLAIFQLRKKPKAI